MALLENELGGRTDGPPTSVPPPWGDLFLKFAMSSPGNWKVHSISFSVSIDSSAEKFGDDLMAVDVDES